MAPSARRIALIYDARLTYDLKVMTGVAAYLQEGHHYSVFIEENALKDQRLPDLRSWEGDGIIADFDDPAVARLVTQSRLPVVGFGGGKGSISRFIRLVADDSFPGLVAIEYEERDDPKEEVSECAQYFREQVRLES